MKNTFSELIFLTFIVTGLIINRWLVLMATVPQGQGSRNKKPKILIEQCSNELRNIGHVVGIYYDKSNDVFCLYASSLCQ